MTISLPNFAVNEDNFNSTHFNLKMGNIIINKSDIDEIDFEEQFNQIFHLAIAERFKHLTIKVPTWDKRLASLAIGKQMRLVDTLVRYLLDFSTTKIPEFHYNCMLDDCQKEDLDALKKISRSAFKFDRFHSDPALPDRLCDEYYEKWIENSFYGLADKIIVAYQDGQPVGYTTVKVYPDELYGQLVLSAVSEAYRGFGVYTNTLHRAISWLDSMRSNELKGALAGTQIENISIQKACLKMGFAPFDSYYVFHKDI